MYVYVCMYVYVYRGSAWCPIGPLAVLSFFLLRTPWTSGNANANL